MLNILLSFHHIKFIDGKNEIYFKILFNFFVKHFQTLSWHAPSGAPACSPSSDMAKPSLEMCRVDPGYDFQYLSSYQNVSRWATQPLKYGYYPDTIHGYYPNIQILSKYPDIIQIISKYPDIIHG